jgi:hypothetical protein
MAGTLGDEFHLHVLVRDPGSKPVFDGHNKSYSEREVPEMLKWTLEYLLDPRMIEIKITREDR